MKNFRQLIIFAVLLAGALGISACSSLQAVAQNEEPTATAAPTADTTVLAEGRIEPKDSAWLGFDRTGRVAEVLVAEGEAVTAGQPLARLDNQEQLKAAVTAAELERLNAQQVLDDLNETADLAGSQARTRLSEARRAAIEAHQALDDLDTQEYADRIDDAWVAVQDATTERDDAQEDFDKLKDLSSDNAERQAAEDTLEEKEDALSAAQREVDRLRNDLEQARSAAAQADAAAADAQAEFDKRQNGPDPADLAVAQARVDNAVAQAAAAQAALSDMELTAPFDGIVTRLDIRAGEAVTPGLPVLQVADFSEWFVETTDLTEIDIVRIDASEPASIVPDALPDLELTGEIERLAKSYTKLGGDVLYPVRIRLTDGDPDLRWGMTVEVRFARR